MPQPGFEPGISRLEVAALPKPRKTQQPSAIDPASLPEFTTKTKQGVADYTFPVLQNSGAHQTQELRYFLRQPILTTGNQLRAPVSAVLIFERLELGDREAMLFNKSSQGLTICRR